MRDRWGPEVGSIPLENEYWKGEGGRALYLLAQADGGEVWDGMYRCIRYDGLGEREYSEGMK